jgi:hypothetical protein
MRDPERTVVCDILANGFTLEPGLCGDRYTKQTPAPVRESGPWSASCHEGRWSIESDDFEHDVVLWILGDFGSDEVRAAYAHEIARRLNGGGQKAEAPSSRSADLSNKKLRELWLDAGGEFYGPHTEPGRMSEAILLPFLQRLAGGAALQPASGQVSSAGGFAPRGLLAFEMPSPDVFVLDTGHAWEARLNPALVNDPSATPHYSAETLRVAVAAMAASRPPVAWRWWASDIWGQWVVSGDEAQANFAAKNGIKVEVLGVMGTMPESSLGRS